jgi:hypothetical protein
MTVAETILQQLGGRRFIAMTGAKNFLGSQNALMFALPGGVFSKRINKVVIELEPSDTYRVKFCRIGRRHGSLYCDVLDEHEDIYAEDLQSLFERVTGLRTKL